MEKPEVRIKFHAQKIAHSHSLFSHLKPAYLILNTLILKILFSLLGHCHSTRGISANDLNPNEEEVLKQRNPGTQASVGGSFSFDVRCFSVLLHGTQVTLEKTKCISLIETLSKVNRMSADMR